MRLCGPRVTETVYDRMRNDVKMSGEPPRARVGHEDRRPAAALVFVCYNLAFRSELLVRRKHTRFGHTRFVEAIAQAVGTLEQCSSRSRRRRGSSACRSG